MAEFPELHHSVNSLPAVLGSYLDIERVVKLLVEGCIKLMNDRATMERTVLSQLVRRLPLGWTVRGHISLGHNERTGVPVLWVSVGRHELTHTSDPSALRLRIELPHVPLVNGWTKQPVAFPSMADMDDDT